MVRGGFERYMKTFPEGGFWKGKNYLFDRRLEQVPEAKSEHALAADVESYCAVCHTPCGSYRGQYTCAGVLPPPIGKCGVPVIVCRACGLDDWNLDRQALRCPLCEDGYVPPQAKPDVISLKRKLAASTGVGGAEGGGGADGGGGSGSGCAAAGGERGGGGGATDLADAKHAKRLRREAKAAAADASTRLFVGSLPFATCASDVRKALGQAAGRGSAGGGGAGCIVAIRWLSDQKTNLFYGSAFVQVDSLETARAIVRKAAEPPPAEAASAAAGSKQGGGQHPRQGKKLGRVARAAKAAAAAEKKNKGGIAIGGRRIRVHFAPTREGDDWPPRADEEKERPPAG